MKLEGQHLGKTTKQAAPEAEQDTKVVDMNVVSIPTDRDMGTARAEVKAEENTEIETDDESQFGKQICPLGPYPCS